MAEPIKYFVVTLNNREYLIKVIKDDGASGGKFYYGDYKGLDSWKIINKTDLIKRDCCPGKVTSCKEVSLDYVKLIYVL